MAGASTRPEVVRAWLDKVASDVAAARRLANGDDALTGHAAFHCQQAAEKLVKAVLVARGIQPPRSHDIERLCGLLPDEDPLISTLSPLAMFTPFVAAWRYPSDPLFFQPDPDRAEIGKWTAALDDACHTVRAAIGVD